MSRYLKGEVTRGMSGHGLVQSFKKFFNHLAPLAFGLSLMACAGLSGGGASEVGPGNGAGNQFAGGALDQGGQGGFQGNEPGTQVTQDGVIRPGPGHVLIKAMRIVPPTLNQADVGQTNATMLAKQDDGDAPPPPSNTDGKRFANIDVLSGGSFQVLDSLPPIYLMIQRSSNNLHNEILDSFIFKDWESQQYEESYQDQDGHSGMIVIAPTYKLHGQVVCGGDLKVWACSIVDGKYYVSQSINLNCAYGTYDHPYGTNSGDASTVLTMREASMQACPNQPQAPVLDQNQMSE